ncbi:acyl-CoA dehydrogenase [Pseudomonas sp. S04]|uniref:acyl-CoA dehydrogenase n=1 Tax=unclassified Pseudomonas TaxID=196821 RepID=UPI00131F48F3|nr:MULTISPECIES: acyl-CoA dehydrogenase [unclassified Pseudomonas]QHD01565.1 acyl-CoA dehydrogenase [Pseudomonas sp. S04]QHF34048.1 acyl-CoA dehydrogenase [Pseudomonas sp. S19]
MNRSTAQDGRSSLEQILEDFGQRAAPLELDRQLPEIMRRCLADGQADLPLPGQGQTLQRWRTLAQVAGNDLALLKLFEGHTDAKAILAELDALHLDSPGIWGVWAAEPPTARVRIVGREHGAVQLSGTKAWCSGALQIDHALLTAWDEDDRAQLVALALSQGALRIDSDDWQARGMATTASVSVHLDGARAHCVGGSGAYVQRPGFWHGGAGIAACWYGAARTLAEVLHHACAGPRNDPHAQAHLGAVDAALASAASGLRECAAWIDAQPQADAEFTVRRTRALVEAAVAQVQWHVGRALGATPFCRDPRFARLSADLPVFIRQSHAERDLAELGRQLHGRDPRGWCL